MAEEQSQQLPELPECVARAHGRHTSSAAALMKKQIIKTNSGAMQGEIEETREKRKRHELAARSIEEEWNTKKGQTQKVNFFLAPLTST